MAGWDDILKRANQKRQEAMSTSSLLAPSVSVVGSQTPDIGGVPPPPPTQPPKDNPGAPPKQPSPSPSPSSSWNTDGYAAPQYTATNFGNAPMGFDPAKWGNADHQTPKYVVGRLQQEAMQQFGNFQDPNSRNALLEMIQKAYPGTTFDGKDVIDIPGVGKFDIWRGASAGLYEPLFDLIDPNAQQQAQASGGFGTPQSTTTQHGGVPMTSGASGTGGMGGGFDVGPSTFSDPETARLMDFIQQRIMQLTQPQSDPSMQRYVDAASGYADTLLTPWSNPQSGQALDVLQNILQQVSGAPFSDTQSAALRAEAFDQLEQDRAARKRQTIAQMAARGHGMGSGTIEEALRQIDQQYDALRGQQTRNLTIASIEQANRNRGEQASIAEAMRRLIAEDRGLQDSRTAQGIAALQAVTQALAGQRAEQEGRLDKALTLTSMPMQIADQRLGQAMQLLGMGGAPNPANIFNSLASLFQSTQANDMAQQAQNANFWLALGSIVGQLPWDDWFGQQGA